MPRIFEYIADAVRRPREQLTRGQHFVRYCFDLAVHGYRQLQRHRAEGMAAELTYRTIFALIPVVVLGLVMFRVFGGLDEVQNKVENELYSFFGVPDIPDAYLVPDAIDATGGSSEAVSGDGADAAAPANGSTQITDDGPSQSGGEASEDGAGESAERVTGAADPSGEGGVANESLATEEPPESAAITEGQPAAATTTDADELAAAAEAKMQREARANIRRTLSEVTAKVSSIDFASIGVFGLLLFIYAAVALADSTEHLFNRIYEAPTQRPLHIRVAIHWSIITLGSGLLAMSLYMSGQVIDWFGTMGAGSTIRYLLSHAVAVMASWVLLFLLYALMPNTHVSVRAAAIGSVVAALMWEGAKYGFQIYVTKAVPYSAIYGSIGLIPLFLFWIYVTWLIVLFGLILTHTLQTLRGSRNVPMDWDESDAEAGDPDWMLPIMTEVASAFRDGKVIDNQALADRLGLSSRVTLNLVEKLVDADLLRRVSAGAGAEDSLTLARPADKTQVADILSIAHHSRPTGHHPAWQTLANLKQAERTAAGELSLDDVLNGQI